MKSSLALRHALHAHPELSGEETATARRLLDFFSALEPDEVVNEVAGNGFAVAFGGTEDGPTIMLRSELDALPIHETIDMKHRSTRDGVSHKCGHDGHMAILAAVGARLARRRPAKLRVLLMFQPAEETGAGAAAVVADPAFARLRPDRVFALHNLPGYPLGQVVVRAGTFTCASRGMCIRLHGRTAHAAQPQTGRSPAAAMCRVIAAMDELRERFGENELAFATVVGASLGARAFGIAPGVAEVWVTLRTETDTTMTAMVAHCEDRVRAIADAALLAVDTGYEDVFDATVNSENAVAEIRRACEGLSVLEAPEPFRWSEDFGKFTQTADGALFGLGAGETQPDLHDEDYDFPDALVDAGAEVFLRLIDVCEREVRR